MNNFLWWTLFDETYFSFISYDFFDEIFFHSSLMDSFRWNVFILLWWIFLVKSFFDWLFWLEVFNDSSLIQRVPDRIEEVKLFVRLQHVELEKNWKKVFVKYEDFEQCYKLWIFPAIFLMTKFVINDIYFNFSIDLQVGNS